MKEIHPVDVPYTLRDELEFALDDYEAMARSAGEEWKRGEPKFFEDHGTYRAEVDGQAFVWSRDTETWCIVGEDL